MSSKVEEAIIYASEKHAGQVDKQGKPYIYHVLRVGLSFTQLEKPAYVDPAIPLEYYVIVGVLHDVVEDTNASIDRIFKKFGSEIASHVERITHFPHEPYEQYLFRVRTSYIATSVKIADIKDNMSRIPELEISDPITAERLKIKYHRALTLIQRG